MRTSKCLPAGHAGKVAWCYSLLAVLGLAATGLPVTAQTNLGLWPAVQVRGSTIRIWGRSYELARTGLPRAIQSRDEHLLARPVMFRVNGSEASDVRCHFTTTNQEAATWESSGTLAGIPYRCRGTAEFDGMMRFDVEWTANAASNGFVSPTKTGGQEIRTRHWRSPPRTMKWSCGFTSSIREPRLTGRSV